MLAALATAVSGCASMNVGQPQTKDEFVSAMKEGGVFRNTENLSISRPFKSVVADVGEYAEKCLQVRSVAGPSYQYKSAGGSTTYRPKLEQQKGSGATLTVQEQYNDREQGGMPKGGLFVLVAEIRAAHGSQTDVNVYYVSGRGKIVDHLKEWATGDKRFCPSLERIV